jgi:hypothetical protein
MMNQREFDAIEKCLRAVRKSTRGLGQSPTALPRWHAARVLAVSPWTLTMMARSGLILTATIGGRRMIPRSEIERFSNSNALP